METSGTSSKGGSGRSHPLPTPRETRKGFYFMRKFRIGAAAAVLSAPLLLGLAGTANAATEFHSSFTELGPDSARVTTIYTGTTDDGKSFYIKRITEVSAEGAKTWTLTSTASPETAVPAE